MKPLRVYILLDVRNLEFYMKIEYCSFSVDWMLIKIHLQYTENRQKKLSSNQIFADFMILFRYIFKTLATIWFIDFILFLKTFDRVSCYWWDLKKALLLCIQSNCNNSKIPQQSKNPSYENNIEKGIFTYDSVRIWLL